jgi:hypothetical protein
LNLFWEVLSQLISGNLNEVSKELPLKVKINTMIPLSFYWAWRQEDEPRMNQVLQYMEGLQPESNFITKTFYNSGFRIESAFQSQALIHLFSVYCSANRCWSCAIGTEIILKDEVFCEHKR